MFSPAELLLESWEFICPIYMCFVNLEKVYDGVGGGNCSSDGYMIPLEPKQELCLNCCRKVELISDAVRQSWTGCLDAERMASGMGTSGSHFMWMMWF